MADYDRYRTARAGDYGAGYAPARDRDYGRGGYAGPDYERSGGRGFEGEYGGEEYQPEETFRGGREEWGRFRGWQAEGPHVGKGPKGFQRSDERICEDVNELRIVSAEEAQRFQTEKAREVAGRGAT